MDTTRLHAASVATWLDRVRAVGPADWDRPTPCADWSVRDLVNHVVGEDRWTVPLMQGRTIADVGDALDGDLLGDDPGGMAVRAADEALGEVSARLTADLRVHLSYGEESADEYVRQLVADHVIHAWDLAAAVGAERALDPDVVAEVATWFRDRETLYREAGIVGPRVDSADESIQARLLAGSGREPAWTPVHAKVAALAGAFGAADVDGIMAAMTEDCVFESTSPAPDGTRVIGAEAVRQVWADLFRNTSGATFETEEIVVTGDRAVLRWRFSWGGDTPGHVRGIDLLRVTPDGVSEKLSYVKG